MPTPQETQIAAVVGLTEGIYPMEDLVLGMNQGRMMLRSDILEMLHLEEEDLDNIREDLDAEMENIEGIFNT